MIICNGDVEIFANILNGYNPSWSIQVVDSWDEDRMVVNGKHLSINPYLIGAATCMENSGWLYSRDMKNLISKMQLFYGP